MAKSLIKSAEGSQTEENQFELDEQAINEISNAEEFADVEISNEDIMDAVEAIDALAAAVIEKADGEEKEVNADELLDTVTELIEDSHEEEATEEFTEDVELPEEIESSVVRVMVSEDGAIDLEQKPDEIYQSDVDGLDATVFDTTDDYDFAVEDAAPSEDIEDDTLIIGNSASKKMKKGYITIKSSANKKVWSSAVKKVKKMVGSAKFTPAHWAIVSAIAAKAEAEAKLNKQIQSKLVNYIKSNNDMKAKFMSYIKSDVAGQDTQPEIQPEGQTETEAKPDMTAEPQNNGFEETTGAEKDAGNPEGTTSQSGNPTEDPDKQNEREGEIALPEEDIVVVDVPLTNSVRHVRLQKVRSSKNRGYNLYKVVNSKNNNIFDGKVIKSGNIAYCFRAGINDMIVCCAEFVSNGKGTYKPVIKNNKVVISRGSELAPVFQNYEKICLAKQIVSSRKEGFETGKKASIMSAKGLTQEQMLIKDAISEIRNSDMYDGETDYRNVVAGALSDVADMDYEELYDKIQYDFDKAKDFLASKYPKEWERLCKAAMRLTKELDEFYTAGEIKNCRTPSSRHTPTRTPINSAARRQIIKSDMEAKRARANEQRAIESKAKLIQMHEAEERQRLFQSSQTQMNEEKVAIKSSNARNTAALDKIYNSMF